MPEFKISKVNKDAALKLSGFVDYEKSGKTYTWSFDYKKIINVSNDELIQVSDIMTSDELNIINKMFMPNPYIRISIMFEPVDEESKNDNIGIIKPIYDENNDEYKISDILTDDNINYINDHIKELDLFGKDLNMDVHIYMQQLKKNE